MGELQSALDALAVEDVQGMFGPALLDRVTVLLQAQNRIAAELARTVREAELMKAAEIDGLKTMQSWLRGHGRLHHTTATQLVANGRALAQLPATAAGFAAGAITADQVTVIRKIVTAEHRAAADTQGIDLAGTEASLAAVAQEQPHQTLVEVVGLYFARLDPDGPEPDPTDGRSLSFTDHHDGTIGIRGQLDTIGAEKVRAALESIAQAGRCAGDTRSRTQQLADALVQLADNQLASGTLPFLRTVKPTVFVTIPIADLLDDSTGPGAATTDFGGLISAAAARWIACDATITRVVLDPDGVPLNIGRTKRIFPPYIRRATEIRDKHCVFAGCTAPKHWCDTHHLAHWLRDEGDTSLDNSALLCERHHTQVHHGFEIHRDDNTGRWHTHRPDGTEIIIGTPLRV